MLKSKHKLKKNKDIFQFIAAIIYKYELIKKTISLNKSLFPHLYVVTNVLLLLELVTYRGFTFRYLFLNTVAMVFATVFSLLLMVLTLPKQSKKLPKLTDFVLQFNKLSFAPLILINYLLISLDDFYYPNYVYSKFHINPNSFQLILSFNLFIFLLILLIRSKTALSFTYKLIKAKSIVHITFFISVIIFALSQIQTVSGWMYHASFSIMRTINFSWTDKLVYLNGGEKSNGWIVIYTDFINKHVDAKGVIFIPPQKEIWQVEGNSYYNRWFIYPRYSFQVQGIVGSVSKKA